MDKNPDVYLSMIVDAIQKIRDFVQGVDHDAFMQDTKTQSATIMQLQVIGELAKKVPVHVREKIELPWKQITGMRDMISHDYFSLDLDLVWNILERRIGELEEKITAYLQKK